MNKCHIIRLPRSEIVPNPHEGEPKFNESSDTGEVPLAGDDCVPKEEPRLESWEVNDSFNDSSTDMIIVPDIHVDDCKIEDTILVPDIPDYPPEGTSFESSELEINFDPLDIEETENFLLSPSPELKYSGLVSSCEAPADICEEPEANVDLKTESTERVVLGPRAKKTFSRERRKQHEKKLPNVFVDYAKDTTEAEQFFSGNQTFLCATCGVSFNDVEKLLTHMAFHESAQTVRGRYLKSQNQITEHVTKSIIPLPKKDLVTVKSPDRNKGYNVDNKSYCGESKNYCGLCQNSFSKESHLTEHMAIHYMDDPFKCHICGKKFSVENTMNEHIAATHTHPCEMCHQIFNDRPNLETHLFLHTSERPLTRPVSRRPGKKKGFRGIRSSEYSDTEYICEICNRTFLHQLNLRNHLKSHSHPKLLECELCPLRFTSKDYLRNHMTVHTGERPYKCKLCKKAFTISQNLKRHYLYHSGIKPYACNVCNKRFAEKASLKKHLLVHTGEKPYKCHICKKGMSQLGSLRRHMYLHTGDGPFACDICQKRFPYRIVLKYHMIIHTGVRPYKCDLCGKDFNQKGNLKAHKLSHMGIYRSTMKNFPKDVRIETMRKLGV